MKFVVVGSSGKLGKQIYHELVKRRMSVIEVSSKFVHTSHSSSQFSDFKALCDHANIIDNSTVIYLSYLRNPVRNLILLIRTLLDFSRVSGSGRFFYFSTFSIDPSRPEIEQPISVPIFRSFLSFYNINKYLSELAFFLFAKLNQNFGERAFIVRPTIIYGFEMSRSRNLCKQLNKKILICPVLEATIPAVESKVFVSNFIDFVSNMGVTKGFETDRKLSIKGFIDFHKLLCDDTQNVGELTRFLIPSSTYFGIDRLASAAPYSEGKFYKEVVWAPIKTIFRYFYAIYSRKRDIESLDFDLFYFSTPVKK